MNEGDDLMDESVSFMKVSKEKGIENQGLKKKLFKVSQGFDFLDNWDEIEGVLKNQLLSAQLSANENITKIPLFLIF